MSETLDILQIKIEKTEKALKLFKALRNFLEQNYPSEEHKHLVLWSDSL